METRQAVLLGILGVVVIIAAYLYMPDFGGNGGAGGGVDVAAAGHSEVDAAVAGINTAVASAKLNESEAYALDRIHLDGAPAFFASDQPFYFEGFDSSATQGYTYTGFLETGGFRLAIINGIEYALGEEVSDDYTVGQINREFVLLQRRDDETGRMTQIKVPLTEEATEPIQLRTTR